MTDSEPGPDQLQMMAFLDDELSTHDRRAFIERCYGDPILATELASYRRISDIASSMSLREPEDYEYERFFAKVSARIERRLGFVLLASGLVVLAAAGIQLLICCDLPLSIKIGTGIALGGLALLVASVCRMRMRIVRLDRYQGIKR